MRNCLYPGSPHTPPKASCKVFCLVLHKWRNFSSAKLLGQAGSSASLLGLLLEVIDLVQVLAPSSPPCWQQHSLFSRLFSMLEKEGDDSEMSLLPV